MKKGTVYDWTLKTCEHRQKSRFNRGPWRCDHCGAELPTGGNGEYIGPWVKFTPSSRDQLFALLNMANTVDYE